MKKNGAKKLGSNITKQIVWNRKNPQTSEARSHFLYTRTKREQRSEAEQNEEKKKKTMILTEFVLFMKKAIHFNSHPKIILKTSYLCAV